MFLLSGFAEGFVDGRVGILVVEFGRLVFADAGESNTGRAFCPV